MTFYLTYEDGKRGYKCTRCENFVLYENFVPHTCKCYDGAQCQNYASMGLDPNSPHQPSNEPNKPIPSPPRKKRSKNWHLDPKYQSQWHGPGGPWKKE